MNTPRCRFAYSLVGCIALFSVLPCCFSAEKSIADNSDVSAHWTPAGWGGGGFFYSAAFSPDGKSIYLGGDVAGCYRSTDHGKTWHFINNGIAGYGVFALATDPSNPDTVYAATDNGLCKSTDRGDHWQVLPNTGPKQLRITGEKNRSFRNVAVDPTNSSVLYVGSPLGKLYKSVDGAQTWKVVYEKPFDTESDDYLQTQFGKVNGSVFGGFWSQVSPIEGVKAADCTGFGLTVKGSGVKPDKAYITLRLGTDGWYISKNLRDLFGDTQWTDVTLELGDFQPDPGYVRKHPDQTLPVTPDLTKITRFDFACVGLRQEAVLKIKRFFVSSKPTAAAPDGAEASPTLSTVLDFVKKKQVATYGNARTGPQKPGTIYTVAVDPQDANCVIAATQDAGLVMSDDAGQTWQELDTPRQAASVVFAGPEAKTLYATFFTDGVYKSTDRGATWIAITPKADAKVKFLEIAANPAHPDDVYVIATRGWNGMFFHSHDGGKTWTKTARLTVDSQADPTLPKDVASGAADLSNPRNLALNPKNPDELFIAANWRPCISHDAGKTWIESDRGADISCVTDIGFSKDGQRTYVTAMDEGTLVSDNAGESWKQLWPLGYDARISGHGWRVAVNDINGQDCIITTCMPWWNKYPNCVIRSDDGGKTYQVVTKGLPDYVPTANTMWGRSFPRALAVDPNNSDVIYLGMDGAPTDGKSGGGIFKSTDAGVTWRQLQNQPPKRRMFFGLAIDPTDSNRLYWGVGGSGQGLYRSDDGGNTWKHVFSRDGWTFNVMVTKNGDVYCPGTNLWRSTDHGQNWKQLTHFKNCVIVGMAADPANPDRVWIARTTWSNDALVGGVYRTVDGGETWQDITGDLPYRSPMILSYNPVTHELWTGFVGIFKTKQ